MTPDELATFADTLRELLEEEAPDRLQTLLVETHPVDLAHALRDLELPQQVAVFHHLPHDQAGAVLHEMDDQTLLALVQALDEEELSGILDRMPTDNAAEVVGDLPEEQAEKLLDLMKREESEEVQELLRYGEKTAGRIMNPEFVAVHEEMTVAQALEHVRKAASAESIFYLYVVDDHEHLVGVVPIRRLITADPATPVHAISQRDVVSVTPEMDQEEVARLVTKHNLLAVPVVGRDSRLLGTITVDDVIDVIHEEATEDIHHLAGVSGDERVFDPAPRVFPRRLVWRLVNLGTALLAASVIGLFESSIQTLAVLAVFMPAIASEGGIATTQTAIVVIRGLALGDFTPHNLRKILLKEITLSLTTGVPAAVGLALVAYLWKGNAMLSLVCGVALFLNMLVAAVVGTLIPVILKQLRIDPAIASSVILTTFTDVFGFFSFLGLATLLLHFLL